ncbi:MAG: M23 family metallopeptidase [Clostridia bacterium]|nr:M23 family metallopeptidase [Clostridia bacterium]
MERTLTPDEKIKRAEEIYYKKKIQATNKKVARVNVSEKKEYNLLKKMFLQITICILIYLIFYMIQNTKYIFSESVIKKTNEILSYDINISNLYNNTKEYINSIIKPKHNLNKEETNDVIEEQFITQQNEDIEQNENNIGGENIEIDEEEPISLTQMEQDAKSIIETNTLIIPLQGTITSRYGPRNPTTETVPKYHTGIDIAANEGTAFIASMSGIVETVSSVGDYGNHIKIANGDVITLYAHCKTIYVKQGDKVTQGQQIGEVGATGNVTGAHLHFEIRKQDRYVDPDLILKFE